MKPAKSILILAVVVLASFTFSDSDCRNFSFGTTEAEVMKNANGNFVGKSELIHNLKGLTFLNYEADGIYFNTYIFHNGGLYGLKTKKASLTGNDTKLNAVKEYDESLKKYNSSCIKEQITETKDKSVDQDLKCFTVSYPNKTIFVNIEKESTEYFLVETTMQKGLKKL